MTKLKAQVLRVSAEQPVPQQLDLIDLAETAAAAVVGGGGGGGGDMDDDGGSSSGVEIYVGANCERPQRRRTYGPQKPTHLAVNEVAQGLSAQLELLDVVRHRRVGVAPLLDGLERCGRWDLVIGFSSGRVGKDSLSRA